MTATYSRAKLPYLLEAAESVFSCGMDKWRWWLVLDGADAEIVEAALTLQERDERISVFQEEVLNRKDLYRPAVLLNKYCPMMTSKYFYWLSDDDLIIPGGLPALVAADADVSYGMADCWHPMHGVFWEKYARLPAHQERFGPGNSPSCKLDGGQVLVKVKAVRDLFAAGWRFPEKWINGNHSACDAFFLEALANRHEFVRVAVDVVHHRATTVSESCPAWIAQKTKMPPTFQSGA